MTTRVLVVEDESIVAESICRTLQGMGYQVEGACAVGSDAIARVALRRPDVVLMDIGLRGEIDGIEAATRVRTDHGVPVIFLTAYGDDATIDRAKQACAEGFVLKPFQERELKGAIETALFRLRAAQGPVDACAAGTVGRGDGAVDHALTLRELEVLRLVARGMTSKEIAEQLGISHRTVETHRWHVMEKMHLRSAADLVCFAVRLPPLMS